MHWLRPLRFADAGGGLIVAIKVESEVSVLVHTQSALSLTIIPRQPAEPGLIFEMHTIYCFIGPSRWRDPERPRRPSSRAISHFADSSNIGRECVSETDMRPWNVESKLSKR